MISNHTHCAVADAAQQLRLHSPELEALKLHRPLDPLSPEVQDEHELDLYKQVSTNSGQIVRMLLTCNAGFLGTCRLHSLVRTGVIICTNGLPFISWSYSLN